MLKIRQLLQITVLSFILIINSSAWGMPENQILVIKELDDDGKPHDLKPKDPGIVDINSKISINIDKDKLRMKALQVQGKHLEDRIKKLIQKATVLKNASKKGISHLPKLQKALTEWAKKDSAKRDINSLQKALRPGAKALLQIIEISKDYPPLREILNETLEKIEVGITLVERNRIIYQKAAEEAARLVKKVDELAKKEGIQIQLGAWILTDKTLLRPIHLPGFDEYPLGERVVVERWNLALEKTQQDELKNLSERVEEINKKGLNASLDIRPVVKDLLIAFQKDAISCIAKVETDIDSIIITGGAALSPVLQTFNNVQQSIFSYKNVLENLEKKYKEGGLASRMKADKLLEGTNSDLLKLVDKTKGLSEIFDNLNNTLNKQIGALPSTLQAAFNKLISSVIGCKNMLEKNIIKPVDYVKEIILLFETGNQLNTVLLEFSDKVFKLDIDNVPEKTEFSLINTGVRKSGDSVIVKIAASRPKKPIKELQVREIKIFRVLSHIDVIVGLIFARSTDVNKGAFQAAPSYSVLYKSGSRDSVMRNRLLTCGVGLNMAAMDFNHDDTPELGVGLVGSFIRDYIQVGGGYNISLNDWYWFFGLRLPVPTFSLPGAKTE